MKKLFYTLLSVAFLALSACSKNETPAPSNDDDLNISSGVAAIIKNPISNDDVLTKALSGDFEFSFAPKDKIDVFAGDEGEQMIYGIKLNDSNPRACSFKVSSFGLLDGEYFSIYPTQGAVDDPNAIPVSFMTQEQNGNNNTEHLAKYDYNFSKAAIENNNGLFKYEHLVAWARLRITFTSNCTVKSVSLSTEDDLFVGEATINAFDGTLTATSMTNRMVLSFKEPVIVKAGETLHAYITLAPVNLSGKNLTVSAECVEGDFSETRVSKTVYSAGGYSTLPRTFGNGVAMIGANAFESLNDAFASVKDGETIEIIKAGSYVIPNSGIASVPSGVTVKANTNGVVFDCTGTGSIANITNGISFENIEFEMGQTEYHGFYHSGLISYKNCVINGYYKTYGPTKFEDCVFNQTTYAYCLNAYGTDLDVKNCTFNNVGKAFYAYTEGNPDSFTVNFDGCTFNVNYDGQSKAKTQIFVKNNVAGQKYVVNIDDCEINVLGDTDYSDKSVDPDLTNGQGDVRLWNVEEGANGPVNETIVVNLDGVKVYPFVAPSVAKVGDTEYTTLDDAIKAALAANDGVPVVLTSDITYAEGASFTPVVFNGGTVEIDGDGHTVTGLPGMLFNKQGSGGHHLRVSNITFDGAKVNVSGDYAAVIVGYADSMNELYFENVTIKNSTVTGSNYAGAFVGYAAGWSKENDGPVYQHITFKDCSVENNTITGGGSTGALIGHAAGNTNAVVTVDGTTVTGNTIKSTGSSTSKAGSLFGTVGNAGSDSTPDLPKGLFVSATVSGNTVTSGAATITTICGRQGSAGGRLVMNAGGSYDARPYNDSDVAWASCAAGYMLEENNGVWSVVEAPTLEQDAEGDYLIKTADDLVLFSSMVNDGDNFAGKTVVLAADIDMTGIDFTPIAQSANWFAGVFDGQNHTIKNLTVNTPDTVRAAMFGGLSHGTVKNFTLDNPKIQGGADYTAAVSASGNGTIQNVTVLGGSVKGTDQVGGIAGFMIATTIDGCTLNGTTIEAAGDRAGGIIGKIDGQNSFHIDNNTLVGVTVKAAAKHGVCGAGGLASQLMTNTLSSGMSIKNNEIDVTTITAGVEEFVPIANLRAGYSMSLINADNISGNHWVPETVTSTTISNGTESVVIFNKGFVPAAMVGNTAYASLAEAIAGAQSGDVVTLMNDVNVSSFVNIPATSNVVIDLNGKTVTSTSHAFVNRGTATFKNGSIVSTSLTGVTVLSNSVTNFEAGVTVSGVEGAVSVNPKSSGAEININGGSFSASDNAVIILNGTKRDASADVPNTININDGTFTGNIKTSGYVACGIYSPNDDIINVNGGTFNITNGCGICARAGVVTVRAGKFTTTGSITGKVGDSRNVVPCAAIVYDEAANYPGQKDKSVVSVPVGSTAEFVSSVAPVSVLVKDGSAVQRVVLSDGLYSGNVNNFCADGYTAVKDGNNWVVVKMPEGSSNGSTIGLGPWQ